MWLPLTAGCRWVFCFLTSHAQVERSEAAEASMASTAAATAAELDEARRAHAAAEERREQAEAAATVQRHFRSHGRQRAARELVDRCAAHD